MSLYDENDPIAAADTLLSITALPAVYIFRSEHDRYIRPLRSNVSNLGQILGDTMRSHLGDAFVEKVEQIRQLAKQSRQGDAESRQQMLDLLTQLPDDELVPFAKAFNQFLNLANIAEQFHTISRNCDELISVTDPVDILLGRMLNGSIDENKVFSCLENLDIDLVLTAHPTEISRRTLIQKYTGIIDCLTELENDQISERESRALHLRLRQLIAQIWHTNEIRNERPTPVDEARWGLATVENSCGRPCLNSCASLMIRLNSARENRSRLI